MIGDAGFLYALIMGAKLTILIALGSLAIGLIMGLIWAKGTLSKSGLIRSAAFVTTSVIRGIPELIILFTVYFGGSALLSSLFHQSVILHAVTAGIIALSLIFSAYASEVFRSAFLAISKGQIEAAETLGLTPTMTFFHIQLPQMWTHALPGLSNLWLVLLKDTALVSLIGIADLMNQAHLAASQTSEPFTYYCAAGVLYLLLTSLSSWGIYWLTIKSTYHEVAL